MTERSFNRRGALKFLAIFSSSFALGASSLNLKSLLESPAVEDRVHAILKKHFDLTGVPKATIGAFAKSLLAAKSHRENSQFFLEHLNKKALEERLEIYVIEEFCVSTNYLMVRAGEASEVTLLDA